MSSVTGKVVVIAGASSGIGRATAVEFARHGARLVLAARNEEALNTLAAEVSSRGGEAAVAACDVARFDDVQRVARLAVQRFGGVDVWVNNAGVSTYGSVEQMDVAEIQRVIQVNLLGQIHGMKAALPHLRDMGGAIINVSSILGKRAVPLQAPYSAAKHGVVGFSEALRMELRHGGIPVHVVDVRPSGINTPLFEHARSKIGVHPRPTPPVYEPVTVARAIVRAARTPTRDVIVGGAGWLYEFGQRLSPALMDWYALGPGRMFNTQRTDQPDNGTDNLFSPVAEHGRTTGLFGQEARPISFYTRLTAAHPVRNRIAVGLTLAIAAWRCAARAARRRSAHPRR